MPRTTAGYRGDSTPHPVNGTLPDAYDDIGIPADTFMHEPVFAFEAGRGPDGALLHECPMRVPRVTD